MLSTQKNSILGKITLVNTNFLNDPYVYAKQDNFQTKPEEEKAFNEYNTYIDIDEDDIPF